MMTYDFGINNYQGLENDHLDLLNENETVLKQDIAALEVLIDQLLKRPIFIDKIDLVIKNLPIETNIENYLLKFKQLVSFCFITSWTWFL